MRRSRPLPSASLSVDLSAGAARTMRNSMRTVICNHRMRFIGLDSFADLPEIHGVDAYKGNFTAHQYSASSEQVRRMLDTHQVDWDRTLLIPEFYEDKLSPTLKTTHDLRAAAVAVIDCDQYESASQVLRFLADDMLLDGTILVRDD